MPQKIEEVRMTVLLNKHRVLQLRMGQNLELKALAVATSVGLSVALAFLPGFGLDKTSALGGALGVPWQKSWYKGLGKAG